MLDLIRKKQKSIIIKVVFWAIIATFVGTIFLVWGKGSDQGGEDPTVAAMVAGTRIGFDDFQTAYSNLYRLYQNVYREQLTPALEKELKLRQQALDLLIEQALLLQEAKRQGIKIGKDELVGAIAAIPSFQEGGVFSRERYLQVLAYQRLTPDQFEEMQRRDLLLQKVREKLQGQVTVDDEEVAQEFRDRSEKVDLAFVRLHPERFIDRVRVDEQDLAAFFAANREQFRRPETVALRYVVFEPDRFAPEVTLAEEELEKFYRRHLDRFEIAEQVKAAHILIRVSPDADQAGRQKRRELAEKVLEQTRAGKDFAALARQHSEDPGSAARGGDLGYFPRGAMVAPFEQAAFALQPGEISEVVETPFGFHVIKVEGHIEAGVKPLAEVTEEVRAGLRAEKARQLAFEKAMDAYNLNRKEGSLEAAAQAAGLAVRETGFFGRQEPANGLGEAPEFAAAFTLAPGELARPVNLPQGAVLFTVKERRPSRLPELVEVRTEAERTFRGEKARELARTAAERILAGLREGRPLAALAREQGAEVEETGLFTRAYGALVPRLGESEALAKAAFALTRQAPAAPEVFEIDGAFVAAGLRDRQAADPTALTPTQKEELREAVLARKKEETVANRLKELREQADIHVAEALRASLEEEK